MLKENQYIHTIWNSSNKKHLISKGYTFTKIYDDILIKAEDLSNGSKIKVVCYCDYCGKEILKSYCDHIVRGDCCKDCYPIKVKETLQSKYGVDNVMAIEGIKEKVQQTNLERYGCTCSVHNPQIKEQIKQHNLEKYGNEYYFGSEEGKKKCQEIIDSRTEEEQQAIMQKMRNTCLEKYGTSNCMEIDSVKEKIIQTNLEKYGVPYVMMNDDIRAKQIESAIANQTNRTSKQEQKCYNIIKSIYNNCLSSTRCGKYTLDCVLNYQDLKIDIEYDGWYWHKNIQEYDNKRNTFVIKQGYRVIRILSEGKMPTQKQIQDAVNDIVNNNKKIYYIDIRNHK